MVFRSSDTVCDDCDRDIACEASIEASFDALINRAVADGWSEDEVANALLSLAQHRIETMRADAVIGADAPIGRLSH